MIRHGRVTILHNPRCSKSRATLQLIRDRGIEPVVVEYLKDPPTSDELTSILDLLGLEPRQLMRSQESEYVEQALGDPSLGPAALIAAMVKHPKLIERPIVLTQGKAVIGRPPERVLELIEEST